MQFRERCMIVVVCIVTTVLLEFVARETATQICLNNASAIKAAALPGTGCRRARVTAGTGGIETNLRFARVNGDGSRQR